MQKVSDYDIKQAIGIVARLGGFAIKSVATSDDLKERTLTVKIVRVSEGWVQETIDFEDIPQQLATIDGTNGHVDKLEGLQIGDRAETGAEADKEINDAAASALAAEADAREAKAGDDVHDIIKDIHGDPGDESRPDIHLVGEAAALAGKKQRR